MKVKLLLVGVVWGLNDFLVVVRTKAEDRAIIRGEVMFVKLFG